MALKIRENIVNSFTMPVGAVQIAAHSICSIASSLLVIATASTEATGFFIVTEIGYASREVRCAGIGSICYVIAHDGDIAEGELVCAAALGRADSVAALTGATQYTLGRALCASSAAGQRIPILYGPEVATKAAS